MQVDLEPKGAEAANLEEGDAATFEEEMKPSELKVRRDPDQKPPKPHGSRLHPNEDADPAVAVRA